MELTKLSHRRCHVLFGVVFIFFSCTIFIRIFTRITPRKNALLKQLAELEMKIQRLDMMYRERQKDAQVLEHHLYEVFSNAANFTMSTRARDLLKQHKSVMRAPSIFNFQPHLLNPSSLQPALQLSNGRSGVSMILGIPTVKRETQSYLFPTLRKIIDSMDEAEQNDTIIVVLIGETSKQILHAVVSEINLRFKNEVDSGLLEVIAPPKSYYPQVRSRIYRSLGDPFHRVWWRSKQNLDFAFLMAYSMPKARFYVQLEDDVVTRPRFVTIMKSAALERIGKGQPWFALNFCPLGFIGKLFRCSDLPWLIQFLLMFYNDKPSDWLLYHLLQTKVCTLDQNTDDCRKNELWVGYEPSLFQHIGTHSSLKGKTQILQVTDWPINWVTE